MAGHFKVQRFKRSHHGTGGGRICIEISSSTPAVVPSVPLLLGQEGNSDLRCKSIPVDHPFQIIRVEFLSTANRYS